MPSTRHTTIVSSSERNRLFSPISRMKPAKFDAAPVSVSIDGVRRTLAAGGVVSLAPGESICLTRGLYHRFWGEGKVLVGEVSQVNDDFSDNRFYEAVGRFPSIDEDEAPWRLLVSDYAEKIR